MISKEDKLMEIEKIEAILKVKEKELAESKSSYNRCVRARDKEKKLCVQNGLLGMAFGVLTGVFVTIGVASIFKSDVAGSVISFIASLGCGLGAGDNMKKSSKHAANEDRFDRWAKCKAPKIEKLQNECRDLILDKDALEELIEQE